MVVSVEEVASSLVREYLSRKGLMKTIACMDVENPRTDGSINNRSDLRQILHVEDLYKKNKAKDSPLKTMLEIIVRHLIDGQRNEKDVYKSDPVQTYSKTVNKVAKSSSATPNAHDNITWAEGSTVGLGNNKSVSSCSFADVDNSPPGPSLSSPVDSHFRNTQRSIRGQSFPSEFHGEQSVFGLRDKDCTKTESAQSTVLPDSALKNKTSRVRRGLIACPVTSSTQELNRKRQTRKVGMPHPLDGSEENSYSSDGPSVAGQQHKSFDTFEAPRLNADHISTQPVRERQLALSTPGKAMNKNGFERVEKDMCLKKTRRTKSLNIKSVEDPQVSEMILDDIGDDDEEELSEFSRVSFQAVHPVPVKSQKSCPMDQHSAIALKEILLGSGTSLFSLEWRTQSFAFSDTHDLRYGIVQKKGGPCGVLASIQACLLKKLLFEETCSSDASFQRLRASNTTRTKCLALATAEVLWRAGEEKQAILAITSGRSNFIPSGHYKSEGVLEKITCITVDNLKDLQLILELHIQQFESGDLGCILLTISAVLSRSIEKVREDMDVPTSTLIGAHGYCTQELVNLLLCGRAVSNVFDNDMELDSGNGNLTLLKGIKSCCDIGLLSLFEHYNICKVGANLKNPRFPIWVVCSESHFSVLFGLQRELSSCRQNRAREFDLYYYDGLANQQEEIRLSVSFGSFSAISLDPDLVPPLELCIRTKWSEAVVNWNDTEPIL